MSDRLRQSIECLEREEQQELRELETASQTYLVSQDVAFDVERELARVPQPGSIDFEDAFGESHRVLAWSVLRVAELTSVRRRAWRAFVKVLPRTIQEQRGQRYCGIR